MLAAILLVTVDLPLTTIAPKLETALAGKTLGTQGFHRTLAHTLNAAGAMIRPNYFCRVDGDAGARLLTVLVGDHGRVLLLLHQQGRRLRVQGLTGVSSYGDPLLSPTTGHWSGRHLVLAGYIEDGDNFPHYGVQRFERVGDSWSAGELREFDYEASTKGIKFIRNERRLVVYTRRDAPHLDNPHGAPHETWKEVWQWQDRPTRLIKRSRLATPLAAVNDVVGFVRRRDRRSFNRRVVPTLRARLWDLLSRDNVLVWSSGPMQEDSSNSFDVSTAGHSTGAAIELRRTSAGWIIVRAY